MKILAMSSLYKICFAFILSLTQFGVWAQDSTGVTVTKTTTTTTNTSEWYTEPWVWVVGGAVLLIILVALLRGGNSTKEVTRTTVIKEDRP
jgi:cell division protein FtsW (lipid II flippase)